MCLANLREATRPSTDNTLDPRNRALQLASQPTPDHTAWTVGSIVHQGALCALMEYYHLAFKSQVSPYQGGAFLCSTGCRWKNSITWLGCQAIFRSKQISRKLLSARNRLEVLGAKALLKRMVQPSMLLVPARVFLSRSTTGSDGKTEE